MIEEFEDTLVALCLIAVLALGLWFVMKFKSGKGFGLSELWNDLKIFFNGDDDDTPTTTWVAPEGSNIPTQPLSPPTPAQIANVQTGVEDYEQFANNPEPWQDQAFDWFSSIFTGQGTGNS